MIACHRPGCDEPARGDEYCSADCCRINHGLQPEPTARELEIQAKRTATIRAKPPRALTIRGLKGGRLP